MKIKKVAVLASSLVIASMLLNSGVVVNAKTAGELSESYIEAHVKIDGKEQTFTQPALIISGSTLVPMRAIFEKLGADITWDNPTKTVTAIKGTTTIKLKINELVAYVDGKKVNLATKPQLINGNTMVPLRFVSESLGAVVEWEPNTLTAVITSAGSKDTNNKDRQNIDLTYKGVAIGDSRASAEAKLGDEVNHCVFIDDKVVYISIGGGDTLSNGLGGQDNYSIKNVVDIIGLDNLTYNSTFFTGNSFLIGHVGKNLLFFEVITAYNKDLNSTDFGYARTFMFDETSLKLIKKEVSDYNNDKSSDSDSDSDRKEDMLSTFTDSGKKFSFKCCNNPNE
ncbi:copper amine oxidase N-terminal domain-containing protein [Paenibacillus hexagrammi]|uniref:Copper amine oxidase N-terminal domain-containing protein n=1 Tax=Paenibacillus hexagrammi TaxID=2908839 RepID=A0ABY3ST72_9BACL|nr:copper amine oxidase N-terminal domain-containing protein [Paenibacillus sp. YPD9-1]UJF36570.1 copper amine oxidase N-terminal domain-containing protein [Paenibacillus sp. YPD9-1]